MPKQRFDTITALLNHEIRTPLANLQNYCQLLTKTSLSLQQQGYVQVMETSVQYLLQLTHRLLTTEFISKETKHSVNVAACIQESITIIAPAAEKKGISINFNYIEKHPILILSDPVKLTQILLNLLENAIKSSAHGKINIEINMQASSAELLDINIKIQDTGCGIDKDMRKKLQTLFAKPHKVSIPTKHQHGIGLRLCHNLMQDLGGKITFNSVKNKGSVFCCSWQATKAATTYNTKPLSPTNLKIAETRALYQQENPSVSRLLIVEDNLYSLNVIQNLLASLPLHIQIATTGEEAIQRANTQLFDLILIDYHLPEKTGLATIKSIRKSSPLNKTTPILAMSAAFSAKETTALIKAGCQFIIEKPFTTEQLNTLIQRFTLKNQIFLVDWEKCVQKLGGKTPTVLNLFDNLIADLPRTLQCLQHALQQKNYVLMYETAHKLHGAAAFYGIQPLQENIKQLEKTLSATKKNPTAITESLEKLNHLIKSIVEEYRIFTN